MLTKPPEDTGRDGGAPCQTCARLLTALLTQNPETMQNFSFHRRGPSTVSEVDAWCEMICGLLLTEAGSRLSLPAVHSCSQSGLRPVACTIPFWPLLKVMGHGFCCVTPRGPPGARSCLPGTWQLASGAAQFVCLECSRVATTLLSCRLLLGGAKFSFCVFPKATWSFSL